MKIGNSRNNQPKLSHNGCKAYECSGDTISYNSSQTMKFQNAVSFLFWKRSDIVKRWSHCYQ